MLRYHSVQPHVKPAATGVSSGLLFSFENTGRTIEINRHRNSDGLCWRSSAAADEHLV